MIIFVRGENPEVGWKLFKSLSDCWHTAHGFRCVEDIISPEGNVENVKVICIFNKKNKCDFHFD